MHSGFWAYRRHYFNITYDILVFSHLVDFLSCRSCLCVATSGRPLSRGGDPLFCVEQFSEGRFFVLVVPGGVLDARFDYCIVHVFMVVFCQGESVAMAFLVG